MNYLTQLWSFTPLNMSGLIKQLKDTKKKERFQALCLTSVLFSKDFFHSPYYQISLYSSLSDC